jgi:hypothetical protein
MRGLEPLATELLPHMAQAPFEELLLLWLRMREHWLFAALYPFLVDVLGRPFNEWAHRNFSLPKQP